MTVDPQPPRSTRQDAIQQMLRLAHIATACAMALADDEIEDAVQHAVEIPDLAERASHTVKAALA